MRHPTYVAGEIQVDDRDIERITAGYARAVRESPPPATVASSSTTARA